MEEEIQKILKSGLIVLSYSSWSSPVILMKKKNGQTHLCVDYRKLNKVTVKDAYLLPRINDILDLIGTAKYFTTLDAASRYYQILIHPKDQKKTCFTTYSRNYYYASFRLGLQKARQLKIS